MIGAQPVPLDVAAATFGLDPVRVHSTVHHWVGSDGRFFVKVARDDTALMSEAVTADAQVCAALGIEVRVGTVQGRAAMVTPALGRPVPVGAPSVLFIPTALDTLETYRSRPVPDGLPDGEGIRDRVGALADTVTDAGVRRWCFDLLDEAGRYRATGPQVLVHTDAHLSNWVVGHAGLVTLVDWESAAVASAEVDLAGIAISRLRRMDTAGWATAARYVSDEDAYAWALRVKAVEAGVWIARIWGEAAATRWQGTVRDALPD